MIPNSKLSNSQLQYDEEGERMVHEQVMDIYRECGVSEEDEQLRENKSK
ncbi:hypothetical protein [Alkalihalobacillus trypoxylicola]|nr:hypothetical protein [Alkalihalobacillus trypoxylicola]